MEVRFMRSAALGAGLISLLAGCPDFDEAIVVSGSSPGISVVDNVSGEVSSDIGGIATGPTTNRVVVRGDTAYILNSGGYPGSAGASVQVVDLITHTVTNEIPFPDNVNPLAIAVLSDTKAYVTEFYGDVRIIDPTVSGASALIGTIELPEVGGLPAGPSGIVVAGGFAYTANTAFDESTFGYGPGSVSVIDTAVDKVVDADADASNGTDTPILLGCTNPQDVDVDLDGEILVICTGDYVSTFGELAVIDPTSRSVVESIPLGGSPGGLLIVEDVALVTEGTATGCQLFAVRADTNAVVHDSTNPLGLLATAGYCTVGKGAVDGSGMFGYLPAGSFGAEAVLTELMVRTPGASTTIEVRRSIDLAPSANLPSSVALR